MNSLTTRASGVPALPDPRRLETMRRGAHPQCFVCGSQGERGLAQQFSLQPDGSVQSTFQGARIFEGYVGRLHGGVTAALLDGAMTNCLFARGVRGLTAELNVRYREPIAVPGMVRIWAQLEESHGRLHLLRAELRQEGRVKATALGKFVESHE